MLALSSTWYRSSSQTPLQPATSATTSSAATPGPLTSSTRAGYFPKAALARHLPTVLAESLTSRQSSLRAGVVHDLAIRLRDAKWAARSQECTIESECSRIRNSTSAGIVGVLGAGGGVGELSRNMMDPGICPQEAGQLSSAVLALHRRGYSPSVVL